ncbi:P-loop containing nucleoside triphosphate hydrolase protein [Agrocybe pediades]|nr:P-loop containing nucleoside triphosphate hydrolase protein [Agrocybe pediades]
MPKRASPDSPESDNEAGPSSRPAKRAFRLPDNEPAEPSQLQREVLTQEHMEELEMQYLPQIEAKRVMNRGKLGTPARSGIIKKIELVQFLCHKYLSIDFEDQLNFIVGQNGSGKSAILAGIAVALGCKASETDRGKGLATLIKDGENKAEVTITIKNEGEEAYRRDIYGDRINVTRTINKSGGSTYKIKTSAGKLVSNRKAELDLICGHFNIHVENPVTILRQGASQKLLKNSTPQYKYKQFIEGTFLEQLRQDYDQAQLDIDTIQKLIETKKEYGEALKKRQETLRDEYRDALDAQDLRGRRTRLEREKAWALANEKEAELEKSFQDVASSEVRLEQLNAELEGAVNAFEETSNKIAEENAVHDEIKQVMDGILKQRAALQKTAAEKKKALGKLKDDEREIQSSIDTTKGQAAEIDRQISQESETLGLATKQRKEERRKEIQEMQNKIEEMETLRVTLQDDITQSQGQVNAACNAQQAKKAEFEVLQKQLKDLDKAYQDFTSQIIDPLKQYGRNIRQILDEIDKRRWVGPKPIGPLGLFVKLRDIRYGDVMRQFIGSILCSFVAFHGNDQEALRKIVRRAGNPKTKIMTCSGDLFDFSQGEPPATYLTALRLLEINDPRVERILIDFVSVERTYVAPTRKEADNVLKERGGKTNVAISADSFKVTRWSDGGSKSDPYPALNPRDYRYQLFRHQDDPTVRQREMEEERTRVLKLLEPIVEEGKAIDVNIASANRQLSEVQARANHLSKQIRDAENTLNMRIQEDQEDSPVTLAGLESLQQDYADSIRSLEEQRSHITRKKDELIPELMEVQRSIESLKKDADAQEENRKEVQLRIEDKAVARLSAQRNKEHYEGKKKEEETKLRNLRALSDAKVKEFEDLRNQAASLGDETDKSRRSLRQVEADLASLNNTLSRYESRVRKPIEQIKRELETVKKEFKEYTVTWEGLYLLSEALKESLIVRRFRWCKFLAYKSIQCKNEFMKSFSTRGYFGQMIFDHVAGTLELRVQTDSDALDETQKSVAEQKKDPKALSGGEKSLATLCFLLSLWQVCAMPVTCLDEFDVCMDGENRKVAIKMLIDAAKSAGRQTLIITPLSIENIHSQPPMVVIKQMADPRG